MFGRIECRAAKLTTSQVAIAVTSIMRVFRLMLRIQKLCLTVLIIGTVAMASADPTRTITVVSDIWPPFVMNDTDTPGVDVEVMTAVLNRLEYQVDFKIFPWKRALLLTETGEVDALLDAFVTDERQSLYWFPDEPISSTETALFCRDCEPTLLVNEETFANRSLVINRGYQYSRFGNDPAILKFEVNDFEQGFKMLASGRADYYLVNRTVGQYTLKQMDLDYILPLNMRIDDPSDVYLAFHRSDDLKPLSEAFTAELRHFKTTLAYQAILAKYGIQP